MRRKLWLDGTCHEAPAAIDGRYKDWSRTVCGQTHEQNLISISHIPTTLQLFKWTTRSSVTPPKVSAWSTVEQADSSEANKLCSGGDGGHKGSGPKALCPQFVTHCSMERESNHGFVWVFKLPAMASRFSCVFPCQILQFDLICTAEGSQSSKKES